MRNNRAMKKNAKNEPATTTVRLPPELHQQLKDAASKHGRSLNQEIIVRLLASHRSVTLNHLSEQNEIIIDLLKRLTEIA